MTMGNLRHKTDWVIAYSSKVKICVTVSFLPCFILYLRATSKYKHPGAYIRRGDLTEGFLRYDLEGGANTWRGFFSEFYGIYKFAVFPSCQKTRCAVEQNLAVTT